MDQDWEVVTYGKRKVANTVTKQFSHAAASAHKIAAAEGVIKLKELPSESRQLMIQQRVALGMNQIQLNQLCRLPVNTIRDIEAGKATPTPGQLNIINRNLKMGLKLV